MGSAAKRIAYGGVLMAVEVVSLLLAAYLPTNRLFFYGLSSVFLSIVIMEFGPSAGWIFYAASSFVSFIVVFDRVRVIPYLFFFGIYGMVKFYAEIQKSRVIEYILKFLHFNLAVLTAYLAGKELLNLDLSAVLPWQVLLALAQVVFLIYDYAYTVFIKYYRKKLRSRLKL